MKRFLILLAALALLLSFAADAASPDIVISQVYGGGGNIGAPLKNDFIELFVTGQIQEFIPSSDPSSPPATEIASPSVILLTTGNPPPAPITLTAADTSPAGSIEQLERFAVGSAGTRTAAVTVPHDQGN